MAWNDRENGGFTAGTPWIPCASRNGEISLLKDLQSGRSVFRFYREILALRKNHPAITLGDTVFLSREQDPYFAYLRSSETEKFLFVCNFEEEAEIRLPFEGKAVLSNSGRGRVSGHYGPYETAIFRLTGR